MAKDTLPRDASSSSDIKFFVLDTNVLLHNPGSLFAFADNHVIIPFDVLEELDKFKKDSTDVGRAARQTIRHIDGLREKGHLSEGVKWNGHGGTIQIAMDPNADPIPGLSFDKTDNRIIAVAYRLKHEGKNAIFISKDINARIKSDALGITTEDFENQKVDYETLYSGYRELTVLPAVIDRLYAEKKISVTDPILAGLAPKLFPNEYVLFKAGESQTGVARFVPAMNAVLPLARSKKTVFGISPRNLQQIMALDLLLDDDVQMVTLMGTAGTGKTLLALAAGMYKCFQETGGGGGGSGGNAGGGAGLTKYERLLVARPIMPMGRDIGFLPGTKDEKLSAWMKPIFDNLEFLLTDRRVHSGETANVEA
ncbi:MAG TPA: PIN domain-containing protein, partial [Phycisphaerae bacterium]